MIHFIGSDGNLMSNNHDTNKDHEVIFQSLHDESMLVISINSDCFFSGMKKFRSVNIANSVICRMHD